MRVSDEIESISGYPPADFVDASKRTLVSVTHPDDREPVDRRSARRSPPVDRSRWSTASCTPTAASAGCSSAGVKTIDRNGSEWLDGIIFDITERRATEELRLERETEAARIGELEASRARIIEAADAARRRIERDLHDGAQQRLVVASLRLHAAERATQPGSAAAAAAPGGARRARRGPRGAARARARDPSDHAHRARAGPGRAGAGDALRRSRRARRGARRAARARRRDGALLHGGGGADERRPLRATRRMRPCASGATPTASPSRSATTAAAAPTGRAGPACAASRTG